MTLSKISAFYVIQMITIPTLPRVPFFGSTNFSEHKITYVDQCLERISGFLNELIETM